MWIFRVKKWAARLLFLVVFFGVILAASKAIDEDAPVWAHMIVTLATSLGAISVYLAFKPAALPPPADGLRCETKGPTIQTSEWQEEMQADGQSIRAALLTSHIHELSRVWITRPDNEVLQAYRDKGGWEVRKGKIDQSLDAVGVREWKDVDPEPVQFKWYKVFGRSMRGHAFGNRETEEILNAFAQGAPDPSFLKWKVIERD